MTALVTNVIIGRRRDAEQADAVKSRTEESRGELGECLRITGRLELPAAGGASCGGSRSSSVSTLSKSLAVSSALDTNVTVIPIASWISPDSIG